MGRVIYDNHSLVVMVVFSVNYETEGYIIQEVKRSDILNPCNVEVEYVIM